MPFDEFSMIIEDYIELTNSRVEQHKNAEEERKRHEREMVNSKPDFNFDPNKWKMGI